MRNTFVKTIKTVLQPIVHRFWYPHPPHRTPIWWHAVTLPFRVLYAFGFFSRFYLHTLRSHFIPLPRFPVPIWVIGNITAGGSGKTPWVIAIVQIAQAHGIPVGVISRGYGGSRTGQLPHILSQQDSAAAVGDEPWLIFRKTRVPVAVSKNRTAAAQCLLAAYPHLQCILCDDGLQHLSLPRQLNWIIQHPVKKWGNGYLLPTGPLRQPLQSRYFPSPYQIIAGTVERVLQPPVTWETWYRDLGLTAHGSPLPHTWDAWGGKNACALAAIAHPDEFMNALERQGVRLVYTHALCDHSSLSLQDFEQLSGDLPILITEKDASKCYPWILQSPEWRQRIWVVPLQLHMSEDQHQAIQAALYTVIRHPQ